MNQHKLALALRLAADALEEGVSENGFDEFPAMDLPPYELAPVPGVIPVAGDAIARPVSNVAVLERPTAPIATWSAGMVHVPGHKPLKANSKGLFCPTKVGDGWCQWKP